MTYNELFLKQFTITEEEYKVYVNNIKTAYVDSWKKTKQLLESTYAKLSNVKPENYYNEMIKFNRYKSLLKQIETEYKGTMSKVSKNLVQGNEQNINNMFYRSLYTSEWSGVIVNPILDQNLVNASVTGSIKTWNKISQDVARNVMPQYGTLSSLLKKNQTQDIEKLRSTLTSALIRGQSFTNTAKEMRATFNGLANNSLRVARTEGVRSLNSGNHIQAIESQKLGLESLKMWDSTLDSRVRQTHGNADRQKRELEENYNVGGAEGLYPAQLSKVGENVNCRCASLTIPDGIEPETRRARNPVKEMQWQGATATERKNGYLKDGTKIYPRSQQTDIIQNRSFNEWAKMNNLKYDNNGKIINNTKKPKKKVSTQVSNYDTIQEAQDFAVRNLKGTFTAKYRNLDVETANSVNNALYDMQQKHGGLNINHIETYKRSNSGVYMSAEIAENGLGIQTTKLKINTARMGGNYEELNNYLKKQSDNGLWVSESVKDVAIHETGHFLSYNGKTMSELIKQEKTINRKRIMNDWNVKGSKYSTENGDEALAEAFLAKEKGLTISKDLNDALVTYLGVK